jgi:toluene monooxygenase system protein E
MTAREARSARAAGSARRTYLCLEGQTRKPSDYEITTTGLLYYPARGFEVETPVWQHYLEFQRGSSLSCPRWESFEDPEHTTYSSYVARRRDQETFLDRLFERPPRPLERGLQPLLAVLSALRFPLHGWQMVAAYVGSMAPSGRISVAALFQSADEMRRVQRVCQWLARSGQPTAELDALGRELWQQHAGFQDLRRLCEQLLVTYDWGEALIGLNAVIKPVFDRLLFGQVAKLAKHHDDELLEQTLRSLGEDSRWHEAWSSRLLALAVESEPANAAVLAASLQRWQGRARDAMRELVRALIELLPGQAALSDAEAELERELERRIVALSALGTKEGKFDGRA